MSEIDIDSILSRSVAKNAAALQGGDKSKNTDKAAPVAPVVSSSSSSSSSKPPLTRDPSLLENTQYSVKDFNFAVQSLGIRDFQVPFMT
jgi:hypothetical protein